MITEIPDNLDTPAKGVDFLAELDRQETLLEEQLRATKALRQRLETDVLVTLFDRFEQPKVTSNSGAEAKKSLRITGSLPKVGDKDTPEEASRHAAQRKAAIELAISYGWTPFIKTEVTAQYDKGDYEKAKAVFELLRADNSATVDMTEGIHHTTLQAQVRQRIREGKSVQLDVLGVQAMPAVTLVKKGRQQQ